jgi:hypothetical protein
MPFPERLRERPRRWLDQHEPEPEILSEMLGELRLYLGAEGYEWLAATAVYPALRWDLTLHLGYCLSTVDGRRLLDAERLAAMARLPWFRHGSMPDWLRSALISSLTHDQERTIRAALQALLLSSSERETEGLVLEIARQRRAAIAPLARQIFRILRRRAGENSPLRDYVFASYMMGGTAGSLALELPGALARVIGPRANRAVPIMVGSVAIAIVAGIFFMSGISRRAPIGGSDPKRDVTAKPDSKRTGPGPSADTNKVIKREEMRWRGAGSCSANSCHGSTKRVDRQDSRVRRDEHETWRSSDPHSRAFELLYDERSKIIEFNLAESETRSPNAYGDARCLVCHTTPRPASELAATAWLNADGVGCESCHGASKRWLGLHTTDLWPTMTQREKETFGFRDTKSLVSRAELCVRCHVGNSWGYAYSATEVNHDLIAAGHPPAAIVGDGATIAGVNHELIRAGHPALKFEFSAFLDNMPAHWDEKDENADGADPSHRAPDFPARAWAIGKLTTLRASLELSRERAGNERAAWPEFSEYNCFSCHHDLRDQGWRRGSHSGDSGWGSWTLPLTGELMGPLVGDALARETVLSLRQLADEMKKLGADRATAARLSTEAVRSLGRDLETLSAHRFTAVEVRRLIELVNSDKSWGHVASWDEASQRYLALVPLLQAWKGLDSQSKVDQEELGVRLVELQKRLEFPSGFASPRGFDPTRPRP